MGSLEESRLVPCFKTVTPQLCFLIVPGIIRVSRASTDATPAPGIEGSEASR